MGVITAVQAIARREGLRDDDVDPVIVRRLSALPEHYVLAYFWQTARDTCDRLGLLLQLTRVVIARPATWDPAVVRREHETQGKGWHSFELDRRQCFACDESKRRLYFHHVIEVQNGGSNTARNQVPLCFACHQYLHPWLKDEPASPSPDGFESLGDVFARYRAARERQS